MKKLLLGITIVALVMFASSAMAQTAKVPKNLCFRIAGNYFQLATKSLANVPTSDGTVKMYSVVGYVDFGLQGPVHGSGYVTPGTTTFHTTFSTEAGSATQVLASYELFFNLASLSGVMYNRYDYPDGTIYPYGPRDISLLDCTSLPITSIATAGELDKDYRK